MRPLNCSPVWVARDRAQPCRRRPSQRRRRARGAERVERRNRALVGAVSKRPRRVVTGIVPAIPPDRVHAAIIHGDVRLGASRFWCVPGRGRSLRSTFSSVNHTMERTADRCAFTFQMTSTPSPRARRTVDNRRLLLQCQYGRISSSGD